MVTRSAEIYKYEMPGGQYSNMKSQAESFGLGHKFTEVKEKSRKCTELSMKCGRHRQSDAVLQSSRRYGDLYGTE